MSRRRASLLVATVMTLLAACDAPTHVRAPIGPSGVDPVGLARTPAPTAANPALVFGGESGGVQYLWVANADGSNATALVTLPDFWKPFPTWAPGGDGTPASPYRIAFSNGNCHVERVDVIIDPATGRPVVSRRVDLDTLFVTPHHSCDPDWSPRGDRIAFVNLGPEPDGSYSLWSVDTLATMAPTRLYTSPRAATRSGPAGAPTHRRSPFSSGPRVRPTSPRSRC